MGNFVIGKIEMLVGLSNGTCPIFFETKTEEPSADEEIAEVSNQPD